MCISILLLLILNEITFAQAPDTIWTARYNGPADGWDQCFGCTIDNSTYLYVTGYSDNGTNDDYLTIKYNANTGDTLWTKRYDGPANGDDWAADCVVDGGGNLYVTGFSWNDISYDYLTIKYNVATGDTLWTKRYDGPENKCDEAYSCVLDGSGNLYVTGSSASGATRDFLTIKYNSIGDTIWTRRYEPYVDTAEMWNGGCPVDIAGNLYVTGQYFNGSDYDMLTIKYTSAGNTVWTRIYDSDNEGSTACFADNSGNLYVVGGNRTVYDYIIIAYNATTGDTLWTTAFDGGGFDYAMDCVVDNQGHLYVNGTSEDPDTNMDYLIIKYLTGTGVSEELPRGYAFKQPQLAMNTILRSPVIHFNLPNAQNMLIRLFDAVGRIRWSLGQKRLSAGDHVLKLPPLPSGIYFAEFNFENNTVTKKFLLVK